jgi:hypothetical protein
VREKSPTFCNALFTPRRNARRIINQQTTLQFPRGSRATTTHDFPREKSSTFRAHAAIPFTSQQNPLTHQQRQRAKRRTSVISDLRFPISDFRFPHSSFPRPNPAPLAQSLFPRRINTHPFPVKIFAYAYKFSLFPKNYQKLPTISKIKSLS